MEPCFAQLPKEERTILGLFYYKELSLKEVIDITQFSEAKVKVKLHRGRKHLLSIVKEKVEPEMIAHYGKNKQQNLEDAFLKKHLQEIKRASPKSNFTANIMDAILKEEK
jgi:predicted DNA-binding protein YlxM (UPF0122 family)